MAALTAALTPAMLQIPGASGDPAPLFLQAFVICVPDSRTPSWLRLPDASSARSSRCGGPSVRHLPSPFRSLACSNLYVQTAFSGSRARSPGGHRQVTDEPGRAWGNCEAQQGCGEDGPLLLLCRPRSGQPALETFLQLFLLTCYINVCLLSIWWEQTPRSTFNQGIVCGIYK